MIAILWQDFNFWRKSNLDGSDLASHAQRTWINVIAGDNVELREMLIRKVGDLKRQLGAESADTAVAGLVADQVVSSWLALYYAELAESQSSPSSLKWAEFQLKRLESAHRRHLRPPSRG